MKLSDDIPLGSTRDASAPLPSPEDFDIAGWLSGVRPTRRAVKLYARADVLARMEEISGTVADLPDDEIDDLLAEFEQLREAFEASARWFVVEARSPEWVEDYQRTAKQAMGIKKDPGERQKVAILLGQLAEQIVTPEGVEVAHLERLHEVNAGELNKLVVAMTMANGQVAESAKVLTLDFSSRRSVRDPD